MRPKPLKAPNSLRVGLRGFLLVCLVGGAAIGLFVRWRLYSERFNQDSTTVEGFLVETIWRTLDGRDDLVLLVAYPVGDRHGGVHLRSSGLDIHGERQEGRYWVYTNAGGQGNARPINADVRLTRQDFKNLGETKLWKDHLRPALIEESKRFDQWYLETHGSPNALSRFPLKMKAGSFVARDASGNSVTIEVYTHYVRSKTQSNLIEPGTQSLTTDDGRNVKLIEKGKYEIEGFGRIFSSDDPNAP